MVLCLSVPLAWSLIHRIFYHNPWTDGLYKGTYVTSKGWGLEGRGGWLPYQFHTFKCTNFGESVSLSLGFPISEMGIIKCASRRWIFILLLLFYCCCCC